MKETLIATAFLAMSLTPQIGHCALVDVFVSASEVMSINWFAAYDNEGVLLGEEYNTDPGLSTGNGYTDASVISFFNETRGIVKFDLASWYNLNVPESQLQNITFMADYASGQQGPYSYNIHSILDTTLTPNEEFYSMDPLQVLATLSAGNISCSVMDSIMNEASPQSSSFGLMLVPNWDTYNFEYAFTNPTLRITYDDGETPVTPVPEPGSMMLVFTGSCACIGYALKKKIS